MIRFLMYKINPTILVGIFLLTLILQGGTQTMAQSQWERVLTANPSASNDTTGKKLPKPYKGGNYNYGGTNLPSPRTDAITWADPDGYLWVFGGAGLDENYEWGIFNDMWRYDPVTNSWTVVKGTRKVAKKEDKNNLQVPLSRKEAASWVDKKGNLWLYGGRQLSDLKHLDDLWMFSPRTSTWTRVAGRSDFNLKAIQTVKKAQNATNSPGSRSLAGTWTDKKGNLWLYGGISYQDTITGPTNYYNDLWFFDPDSQKWTWVNGADKPNKAAKTGKKKQDAPDAAPTPRTGPLCWYDQDQDQLWLFGGFGYDSTARQLGGLADMWAYNIKNDRWALKNGTGGLNEDVNLISARREAEKNSPGFRFAAMSWKDANGNFLLTGGHTLYSQNRIELETNIWKYNPLTNKWAILPLKQAATILSSGSAFLSKTGDLYLFGGKELDTALMKARPSNTIWRLKP